MALLLGLLLLCVIHTSRADDPLFLSKYLNNPKEGQRLSKITSIPYSPGHHSGYFTVGQIPEKNTFFWFLEAKSKDPNSPVVVWLQGGKCQL